MSAHRTCGRQCARYALAYVHAQMVQPRAKLHAFSLGLQDFIAAPATTGTHLRAFVQRGGKQAHSWHSDEMCRYDPHGKTPTGLHGFAPFRCGLHFLHHVCVWSGRLHASGRLGDKDHLEVYE
jgi:hypothetical protein